MSHIDMFPLSNYPMLQHAYHIDSYITTQTISLQKTSSSHPALRLQLQHLREESDNASFSPSHSSSCLCMSSSTNSSNPFVPIGQPCSFPARVLHTELFCAIVLGNPPSTVISDCKVPSKGDAPPIGYQGHLRGPKYDWLDFILGISVASEAGLTEVCEDGLSEAGDVSLPVRDSLERVCFRVRT
ncbi:hypothetical protein CC78DRAFT_611291 [Lojkania enalia]|uniref:Uncharacterized protein n=1 Tax=Lojkania enalia TaxID=147567 RepID=A0A9P4NBY8_9PLEO|nr:hypothetical protein CC78DRAFT_611291 [Didymosphaeria enalia]